MKEPNFSFETLDVPKSIKIKLLQLNQNIDFTKRSRKGSNGWLFFGRNRISNQKVAVKFYDWGGDPTYHTEPKNLAVIKSKNVIQISISDSSINTFALSKMGRFRQILINP